MTLTIRKIIVLGIIGTIMLLGNILFVANWLAEKGVVDWARHVRTEYITGTAITIIPNASNYTRSSKQGKSISGHTPISPLIWQKVQRSV